MASRDLIVRIIGDSKSLERSFTKSSATAKVFGRDVETVGKKVDRSVTSIGALTSGRAFAGGIFAAAAITGIRQVTDAAANAQQVLGQTKVALEDSGLSWEQYGKQVEGAAASLTKLGFDDEETLKSIATFARATGDVGKAIDETGLAADVARARYIDLAAASNIVLKASLGQAGALRRIGIDAKNGSSSLQLLTLLQQKYGGAAQAAATDASTANQRLRVSLQNVQEQIGSGLLPVISSLATELSAAADNASSLVAALQRVKIPGAGGLGDILPGAFKAGVLATPGLQIIQLENELRKLFDGDKDKATKSGVDFGNAFGGGFVLGALEKIKPAIPSFGKPGTFSIPKSAQVSRPLTAGQRNQFFDDALARSLDRVQDATLQGQVAKLAAIASTITKRIAITKDITRKLRLEDELVAVGRQRRSVEQQIGDLLKQRIEDAKAARVEEKAEELERLHRRQEAALKKLQSTQFRALGFSAEGGDVIPGVENLRKQLASLTARLGSSDLKLSSKLASQLAGVRKVLSGELGKATAESRSKIQELFAAIRSEFDKGTSTGPLTKTRALNTDAIVKGLGLDPDEIRAVRSRLSQFNTAGRGIAAADGPGGVFGVRQPISIKAPDVFLDGQKISTNTRRHNTVHARRNPKQKRGGPF